MNLPSMTDARPHLLTAAFAGGAFVVTALVVRQLQSAGEGLSRATPLLLVVGLLFGFLAIRYSAAGVPLLVAFIYLNLSQTLVRYHNFPSLLQLLVLGLAFAAWLKRDTDRVSAVARQPVAIAGAVYLLVVFASTSWATDLHYADERFGDFAKAFALFVLATLLMRSRRRFMQGVTAMVAAAGLLSLLILFQAVTGQFERDFGGLARVKDAHIYGQVFQPRIAGPVGDPNFFARMLLLAVAPALMFAFTAKRVWQRRAALAASIAILTTLALTYSRGAMLALAVMAAMLLHALHVRWRSTAAVALAALMLIVVLPKSITQRFITIEEFLPGEDEPLHPDSSFQERQLLMKVAWNMFTANPVRGVGAANYTSRYDDYVSSTGSAARQYNDPADRHYPHNLALEVASETGVIGLASFAALLVACWMALRRAGRLLNDDPDLLPVVTALQISFIGFLVASLFLHLAEPRTLFLLFAFAATAERLALRKVETAA